MGQHSIKPLQGELLPFPLQTNTKIKQELYVIINSQSCKDMPIEIRKELRWRNIPPTMEFY